MTTQAMIEQIDARLRHLSLEDIQMIWKLVQRINTSDPVSKGQYNFSRLPGKWTWQGDALATQRQLRNEW